jgi:hypothetical protein
MSVSDEIAEFGGSTVRALWRRVLLTSRSPVKRQRGSESLRGTCPCGCEMLLYLRALFFRFSRREVEDHT